MAFSPAVLRGAASHFLLDLTWGGQVYHLSEEAVDATIGSEVISYTDGLRFGGSWEDRLDLFASAPSSRSVQLDLSLDDLVDVPKRIKAGHPLGAATAVLMLWVEGQTAARTVISGNLRGVEYGTKEEPVSASLEEMPMRAPGLIPGAESRFVESTMGGIVSWATVVANNPGIVGQYFPIIFGRPGGDSGYGSPAFWFAWPGPTAGNAIVAGHSCVAGSVNVLNKNTGLIEAAALVYNSAGRYSYVVTATMPESAAEYTSEYYVQWPSSGPAGLPSRSDPTVPMRGAGEILEYLLDRSGARVDSGRIAVAADHLNGFRLDAKVIPGKDGRISPVEWVQEHLAPILPISARIGDSGLYYAVWKWDATAEDSVADFDADLLGAERIGQVEYSDPDALYQEIRLDYALDYAEDAYKSTLVYTGARARLDLANSVVLDPYLERGFLDYASGDLGQIRTLEQSSDVVLSSATAHLVCQYLASRYGVQSRLVRYEVDPEWAWLEPGAVITITDSEIGLASEVAIVETVITTTDESVGLGLRILGKLAP